MRKIVIIVLLLNWRFVQAQPLNELEATPSVLSEPSSTLLITEISFKNREADWVAMRYDSPSGKPVNLKGISFADDNIIKTLEQEFIISSGQELLLTFKSNEPDAMPYLSTGQSGLTGTTEQFIVYDQDGSVIDAVCWTSNKPTEAEKKDQMELFEQSGWHSPDVESCLSSDDVKINESIKRHALQDTNTRQDWEQPPTPSPSPEPGLQTMTLPPEELDAPPVRSVSLPVTETKIKQASSHKNSYRNGDLSADIFLSEVLPNPDGSDSGKEWIELTNSGTTTVNLGNWQLDDGEGGSKPYTIPDTLTLAGGTAVHIESAESKLSLGNKEDQIRLFTFQNKLIDEVLYEEAPSGQSYSRINVTREDGTTSSEWLWVDDPTPGTLNPAFREFTAEIISEPRFDQHYSFDIIDQNEQEHTIIFDEALIAGPLAKATFTPGSILSLTIEPNEQKLMRFEVLTPAPEQNALPPLLLSSVLGSIALVGGAAFFLVHKKIPWQESRKTV